MAVTALTVRLHYIPGDYGVICSNRWHHQPSHAQTFTSGFFFFFFPASNANRFWWKQCRLMNFFRLAQGRRYIHGYTGPPGHLQCPRCAVQRWAIKSIKPLKIRDCVWVQIPQGGSSFCWHHRSSTHRHRHRTRTSRTGRSMWRWNSKVWQ